MPTKKQLTDRQRFSILLRKLTREGVVKRIGKKIGFTDRFISLMDKYLGQPNLLNLTAYLANDTRLLVEGSVLLSLIEFYEDRKLPEKDLVERADVVVAIIQTLQDLDFKEKNK
jgi:hypothetical protein